jgi:hypothetical protein
MSTSDANFERPWPKRLRKFQKLSFDTGLQILRTFSELPDRLSRKRETTSVEAASAATGMALTTRRRWSCRTARWGYDKLHGGTPEDSRKTGTKAGKAAPASGAQKEDRADK